MRKIGFLSMLVLSLLIMQYGFGQDCVTLAQKKSQPITRSADEFVGQGNRKPASWDIAKMKPHQSKLENWIRNLLTGFTGAKVGYTNEYNFDYVNDGDWANIFCKATGIKGYYGSTTRFWDYYCSGNNRKFTSCKYIKLWRLDYLE